MADFVMSLVVMDDSIQMGNDPLAGISVNIFKRALDEFPDAPGGLLPGDVLQFRRFRIQHYNGNMQAVSTKWSAVTVFRKGCDGWVLYDAEPRQITSVEEEAIEKVLRCQSLDFSPAGESFRPTLCTLIFPSEA